MNIRLFVLAILLTILLLFLPFAQVITYPFLIFSTFIHETSHAFAAVLTGGHVDSLIVRINGSGVTYTRGGFQPVISSAGYVGTTVFGGILLILSRRKESVRFVLYGCALLVSLVTALFVGHTHNLLVLVLFASIGILMTLSRSRQKNLQAIGISRFYLPSALLLTAILIFYLFATGSLFSWISSLLIAVSLLLAARFSSLDFAHFFLTFLSVQCCLNAMDAIKTVYFLSLRSTCGNDAVTMAAVTGIPAWIWAICWAILSILILGFSAAFYTRRSHRFVAASL